MSDLRAVLDTNIWISGIFFGGTAHAVLAAWREDRLLLINTNETLEEIERKLRQKAVEFEGDLSRVLGWRELIRNKGHLVKAQGKAQNITRDPDDDKFLDAAISGNATHIVTGDKDLLSLGHFESVTILSPRDFLRLLEPE